MILLTFRTPGGPRLGVKISAGILDVTAARTALGHPDVPDSIHALIDRGAGGLHSLRTLVEAAVGRPELCLAESALELAPAVPAPGKIICVGLNYRKHALESGMAVPETPVLFSKFNNALAAHGEAVALPANAVEYDYEAELVAVIGRRARYVSESEALDYVVGYCGGNDLTARDLQFRTNQWLLGKTPDKFMPIGPYLVTADEVGDPQALTVQCLVNGQLRQNSSTADMVFGVAHLVSYISQYMTLEPGDIISTGTPAGVVMGMKAKVWLKPGDAVTVQIDRLGQLTNRMVPGGSVPAAD